MIEEGSAGSVTIMQSGEEMYFLESRVKSIIK